MSNLQKANKAYEAKEYYVALEFYKNVFDSTPALRDVVEYNIKLCCSRLGIDFKSILKEREVKACLTDNSSHKVKVRKRPIFSEKDMHGTSVKLYPKPCYELNQYSLDVSSDQAGLVLDYIDSGIECAASCSIGIHLHLYYEELLDEFIEFFKNISIPFSLYISVTEKNCVIRISEKLKESLPNVSSTVRAFENRGRDISHFVVGFSKELLRHDIIAHFHSKRSPHNFLKADWRRQILTSLIGSQSIVNRIFTIFQESQNIGMVFPTYHHSLKGQISWGTNFSIAKACANRMNLSINEEELVLFPAGSMFWARTEALRPLLEAEFSYDDFPVENSQVDGTLAHGIERLFGHIVDSRGFDLLQVKSSKQYNLIKYFPHKYPYVETQKTSDAIINYKKNKKQKNKVVVFTAVTGGYEELPRHRHLDPTIDYVAFCDTPMDCQGFWDIRPMDYFHPEKVRMARRIKTNPHLYLNEYELAIWIDANVVIESSLEPYIKEFLRRDECVASIHHPMRNCVFHEAKAIMDAKKDPSGRVEKQVQFYRQEKYPEYNGLTETNLMMTKVGDSRAVKLMRKWWSQLVQYSHRDQLSFNYALWSENLAWHKLMEDKISLRDSFDFAYLGHGRNSGYKELIPRQKEIVDPNDWVSQTNNLATTEYPPIDYIVCVHNALAEVKNCLASVLKTRKPNDTLILIDDGSDNETKAYLENIERKHKNVVVHRNDGVAQGYCKSANIGMKLSQSDFFLLLNSDTVLTLSAVNDMLAVALQSQFIGIVGPLSNAASSQSIPNIKNTTKQTAVNNLPNGVTIEQMSKLCKQWSHPTIMPKVPLVHGFCQLIRRSVYLDIGGFDEEAFPKGYGEENDFCLRAGNAGYDLVVCTNAFVFHEKSASYNDDSSRQTLMRNGSIMLKKKHSEDRLTQAIKAMEGHPLLVRMRMNAEVHFRQYEK